MEPRALALQVVYGEGTIKAPTSRQRQTLLRVSGVVSPCHSHLKPEHCSKVTKARASTRHAGKGSPIQKP